MEHLSGFMQFWIVARKDSQTANREAEHRRARRKVERWTVEEGQVGVAVVQRSADYAAQLRQILERRQEKGLWMLIKLSNSSCDHAVQDTVPDIREAASHDPPH
jgi:hypothetical protein